MKGSSRRPRAPAPGARRIENAARLLFANQGYAGTSMAEIAAAGGGAIRDSGSVRRLCKWLFY